MTPAQVEAVQSRARCLYSEAEVELALDSMASAIQTALAGSNPILMCVMNGGLIVAGKLATRLGFVLQMDYLHASRYRGEVTGSDQLQWKTYPAMEMADRIVLVIDDILDQGTTLEKIVAYCQREGASKVYTAVLVDKQTDRRLSSIRADFVGLMAEDLYLYGYGMDYRGYLRNAAGIFAVDPVDL